MPGSFANAMMKFLLTSPLHPLLGDRFAVITVTGRKTGRTISTPINVAPDGNGYTVVSFRARTWWRNLSGGRPASLRISGKTFPVTARILNRPEDVKDGLRAYVQRNPGIAKYFHVKADDRGGFDDRDLELAAAERVIIRLEPSPEN
jgi:deazaflavin-dependent oxidoreductase (nitroreductase family)